MNVASNTMRYRPSFYTGVAALLLGLLTAVSAGAQERAHTVTVSGEGIIKTTPDMATVWFAVLSHHERPERARALNATASAAAMNAVRELGIEEQDIQLEGLQLTPRRVYDPDRRIYDQDGFEALRTVQVTVRDLDVLPDVVAAVVEEGANQINRIQYGLDDRSGIELEVLARAVQRAAEKASVMAAQVGRSIGQALQMSEQGISVPQPRMRMDATEMVAMAKDEGGNPDAFAAGDIEVRATVSVVFSLVDSQE
jgi:uncharacterized protein YggE